LSLLVVVALSFSCLFSLIQFAQINYEENPTESLSALMQALTLNSGHAKANCAMNRIRAELGGEVADHVMDRTGRMHRAARIVEELLADESTILYERGQQHILQQAMEDGSSLVCTKCNGMIPVARWQQHQLFWCDAIDKRNDFDEDEMIIP
jgi:hypothetical protein